MVEYRCSCPDFTKRANKNPNAQSLSEQIDRNWINSNAGIQPDQYCKHIWSAILAEGKIDEIEIPTDLEIPKAPNPSTRVYPERLQANSKRGHYFGV